MTFIDRTLQNWRLRKALRHVGANARVIDVGAHEGELFERLGRRLNAGFGIEPLQKSRIQRERYELVPGCFPAVRPTDVNWDAITLLAVLEHIPRADQPALAQACHDLLRTGGRVIITVPSRAVDHVLSVLKFLRLIDGMSLEDHFGCEPGETVHERFQLGLNHLYVFEKR
jgi:2-polyprenyl-3-methyl-5-hydroxy-6-metoxy-1,4-benzoquinol methylase